MDGQWCETRKAITPGGCTLALWPSDVNTCTQNMIYRSGEGKKLKYGKTDWISPPVKRLIIDWIAHVASTPITSGNGHHQQFESCSWQHAMIGNRHWRDIWWWRQQWRFSGLHRLINLTRVNDFLSFSSMTQYYTDLPSTGLQLLSTHPNNYKYAGLRSCLFTNLTNKVWCSNWLGIQNNGWFMIKLVQLLLNAEYYLNIFVFCQEEAKPWACCWWSVLPCQQQTNQHTSYFIIGEISAIPMKVNYDRDWI